MGLIVRSSPDKVTGLGRTIWVKVHGATCSGGYQEQCTWFNSNSHKQVATFGMSR